MENNSKLDVNMIPKPEWDHAPLNVTFLCKNAYMALQHSEKLLSEKQDEKNITSLAMDKQWADIKEKEKILKEMFILTDNVTKENKESKFRIIEKILDEQKHQGQLEAQIQDIKTDMDIMNKIKCDMETYVKEYSIFETFLEKVVQDDYRFHSVRDILNRYETLENTRTELIKCIENELKETSEARYKMIKITEEKSSLLRILDNQLILLQVRAKQVKEQRMRWEFILERLKLFVIKKIIESETLKFGCWDLYRLVCRSQKKQPSESVSNIEAQLDYIQKSLLFFKEVYRIASQTKQEHKVNQ